MDDIDPAFDRSRRLLDGDTAAFREQLGDDIDRARPEVEAVLREEGYGEPQAVGREISHEPDGPRGEAVQHYRAGRDHVTVRYTVTPEDTGVAVEHRGRYDQDWLSR